MATGSNGYVYGISFSQPFLRSTMEMTDGSALMATSSNSHAFTLLFNAAVTNSTLSITDRSVVEATSSNYAAIALYFIAAVTDSTMVIADGSALQATTTGGDGSAFAIYFWSAFTDSTLVIADGQLTAITGSGSSSRIAAAVYLHCDVSSTSKISISGSVLTGKSTTGSAQAYSFIKKIKTASNYQIGQITLRCSSFAGADDGEGPLDGALKDNAAGKLAVSVTYWNNQTTPLNTSTMLQSYTSSTLSMESGNGSCPLAQKANEATRQETKSRRKRNSRCSTSVSPPSSKHFGGGKRAAIPFEGTRTGKATAPGM